MVRIVRLELGADDDVRDPFNRRELLARVKNLLRRTSAMRQLARRVVSFAGFTFDTAARHVTGPGGSSGLPATRRTQTASSFDLARILSREPLRAFRNAL